MHIQQTDQCMLYKSITHNVLIINKSYMHSLFQLMHGTLQSRNSQQKATETAEKNPFLPHCLVNFT